jgi:hypothetical protein
MREEKADPLLRLPNDFVIWVPVCSAQDDIVVD